MCCRVGRGLLFSLGLWAVSTAAGETTLDAFVVWDYAGRPRLEAWRNTARVIEATAGAQRKQWIENGTPQDLAAFLGKLSGERGEAVSLVYLAAHQSPAAEWDFRARPLTSWKEIRTEAAPNRHRVVVWDACYAEGAGALPAVQRLAPLFLFSCRAGEEAGEITFARRRPVDFERRFPEEHVWLKRHLPADWDGSLSFFGLMWLRTWRASEKKPETWEEWREFSRRCAAASLGFQKDISRKTASTVVVMEP
jgi:hypothetical protein